MKCKKCNGNTGYIKERYSGIGRYYLNTETGEEEDNLEYFSGCTYKCGKIVYCADCDAIIGKVSEIKGTGQCNE